MGIDQITWNIPSLASEELINLFGVVIKINVLKSGIIFQGDFFSYFDIILVPHQ